MKKPHAEDGRGEEMGVAKETDVAPSLAIPIRPWRRRCTSVHDEDPGHRRGLDGHC